MLNLSKDKGDPGNFKRIFFTIHKYQYNILFYWFIINIECQMTPVTCRTQVANPYSAGIDFSRQNLLTFQMNMRKHLVDAGTPRTV